MRAEAALSIARDYYAELILLGEHASHKLLLNGLVIVPAHRFGSIFRANIEFHVFIRLTAINDDLRLFFTLGRSIGELESKSFCNSVVFVLADRARLGRRKER